MREPVGQQECRVLAKVAIVEDLQTPSACDTELRVMSTHQEELGTIFGGISCLQGVWDTGREVPQISGVLK